MAKQAVDVEDLLRWAYQRQQVDRAGTSMADACLRFAARGIPNPAGGGGGGSAALVFGSPVHADADTIHAVVTARSWLEGGLLAQVRDLVIYHARTGSRPDWMPGARAVWAQPLRADGTPKAMLNGNGKRFGCYIIQAVARRDPHTGREVIERGIPHSQIAFERARYTAWRAALVWVAGELRRVGLTESEALDPRAPEQPWSEDRRTLDLAETA